MKTILVIEDNPDNMRLIEEILEDADYRMLAAPDAERGIGILGVEPVDLVLMDISLPGMNGLEATQRIKQDTRIGSIPVLALSAFAMDADREAAEAAGCDAYLTKPIDEDQLLETIKCFMSTGTSIPQ